MGCVGNIGAQDECAVGSVRGSGVCIVICGWWLGATVDGEAGGEDAGGFFLDKHLTAESDGFRLNVGLGYRGEGLICVKVFLELLSYGCGDVFRCEECCCTAYGHFGTKVGEWFRLNVGLAVVERWIGFVF